MWVHSELGTVTAIALKDIVGHIAGHVENGVERKRGVPLGHHEAVAVSIGRPALDHSSIEGGEDVGDRQGGADVTNIRPLRLLEHVAADALAGDRHRHAGQSTCWTIGCDPRNPAPATNSPCPERSGYSPCTNDKAHYLCAIGPPRWRSKAAPATRSIL